MDEVNQDQSTLSVDADFNRPLKRTHYETGMMLTSSTFEDEQNYHRQRMNRHQYWLHGYGTIAGMAVSLSHINQAVDDNKNIRILVHPGIGIDALGRELLIDKTYCINLNEWLAAQQVAQLESIHNATLKTISLKITVSYKNCLSGFQPVLARKLNASTDAVQPERSEDSILLELSPYNPDDENSHKMWPVHQQFEQQPALNELVTAYENDSISNETDTDRKAQLELRARLLHAYQKDRHEYNNSVQNMSRIFLAKIVLNNIQDPADISLDPENIDIDSLIRPFVRTTLLETPLKPLG